MKDAAAAHACMIGHVWMPTKPRLVGELIRSGPGPARLVKLRAQPSPGHPHSLGYSKAEPGAAERIRGRLGEDRVSESGPV